MFLYGTIPESRLDHSMGNTFLKLLFNIVVFDVDICNDYCHQIFCFQKLNYPVSSFTFESQNYL